MGQNILRHQDLLVYKKAIEAAMEIFEVSKSFPKEETYSPYAGLQDPSQRTLPKLGVNDATKQLSSANSAMPKVRPLKPRLGAKFQFVAAT